MNVHQQAIRNQNMFIYSLSIYIYRSNMFVSDLPEVASWLCYVNSAIYYDILCKL